MQRRLFVLLTFQFVLLMEIRAMAQDAKEVPLPNVQGAGKIDADAPKTMTTTSSGLQYRILRKGTGAKPKAINQVEVNYHGWLDDGKVFESSYTARPVNFVRAQSGHPRLDRRHAVGGRGRHDRADDSAKTGLWLAGAGGAVPPNATLHFLVELIISAVRTCQANNSRAATPLPSSVA